MEIKELFEKMKTATEEQNDAALEVFQEIMDSVKRAYPKTYKKYASKLDNAYSSYSGLTEEEAREAVKNLKNEDGSFGPHWDEAAVRSVYESNPELQQFNFWCVYYVLNMVYSDYYDPAYTIRTYVKLTRDFIGDKDAPHDKVRRYIEAMQA